MINTQEMYRSYRRFKDIVIEVILPMRNPMPQRILQPVRIDSKYQKDYNLRR
jgi:hypothetical protein